MTSSETRHLFHCHFSGHHQAWCRGPSPLKLSGEKKLDIRAEQNSKHGPRTCRHVLYLANNSSQSVDLVLPRMYSGLWLAIRQNEVLPAIPDLLSLYHLRKQVSYFLYRPSQFRSRLRGVAKSRGTYSLGSLHSGAIEAAMMDKALGSETFNPVEGENV